MSRLRGFTALLCLVFLSQAVSYGVERFSVFTVANYLDSSENPSRHLFQDGKLDENYVGSEENSIAIFETAGVVVVIKRYCLVLNVFLQILLSGIFCFLLFRKRLPLGKIG